MEKKRSIHLLLLLGALFMVEIIAAQSGLSLEENFKTPPSESKPRTWFHAMSGNMSEVGLTKDLEAIADAGIGGIILFNVTHSIPKGDVIFNSPEHIRLIGHAAAECERLGLSFGIHNCDGWTSSGGPWVTPEHSMKQMVFTETVVEGGKVDISLEMPSRRGDYYKDIAVVAYPALPSEIVDAQEKPKIYASDSNFDTDLITDGKIDKRTTLEAKNGQTASITFEYQKPFTLRSLYANFEKRIADRGKVVLKISDNGVDFQSQGDLKLLRMGKKEHGIDMTFSALTARFFKIESEITLELSEVDLSATVRFDNALARTSLFKIENHRLPDLAEVQSDMIINKKDMIDLSGAMDEKGNLVAELPKGKWSIMRFGYTIMGAVNSPASEEGRGWEVDKMSRESFKTFYDGYVKNVIDVSKPVAPKALQYIEIDSYEVGGQNWTKDYEKMFIEQLGYDILDYLPLYAGRYIEDAETTERILWDVRNFNSKLMTDNYFDYFTELCHNDGLISYVEPYSFNASFNELDASKKVDIPMGEFWMHQRYQTETAVSGARIYGKNIVSAESFSARPEVNWQGHPGTLKLTGDKAWTYGINEFMFHRFAHQANTKVEPGMTMSQWGSHIDRTQTWWDNAGKAWFKYLARGQYLLRQGIPVSNLLVYVGDGSPNSTLARQSIRPSLPNHTNFDCINTDALVNRIMPKNKKLVLPNGIEYRALHLTNVKEMRLVTLRKISELANAGIVIVGPKPSTLGGFNHADTDFEEFDRLIELIWSKPTTYTSGEWDAIFKENNIPIDLVIEKGEDISYIHRKTAHEDIYFFYNPDSIQRTYMATFNVTDKIPEFWNQMTGETKKLAAFEHSNKKTQVAVTLPPNGSGFIVFRESATGTPHVDPQNVSNSHQFYLTDTNDLVAEISENGRYRIKLSNGAIDTLDMTNLPDPVQIKNDWEVTFPAIKAKERTFNFPSLIDWTAHDNEGVKYYSGTAIYKSDFDLSGEYQDENHKLILDLGNVNVAARIILNGKDLGVLWISPYHMDVSTAVQEGKNTLQIEVTNQWTNRLIGDENYPDVSDYQLSMEKMPKWYTNNEPANLGGRSTFTTYPFYEKGDNLLPAGLIGPVHIQVRRLNYFN